MTAGMTKLDVAQREINAAVRLLFDRGDPLAVMMIAAAARGILSDLCKFSGKKSFIDDLHEEVPSEERRKLYREANYLSNWCKHADSDPQGQLVGFEPFHADSNLFMAVYDFGTLCSGKSIEAQVFEGWFLFQYGTEQDLPSGLDQLFPDLRVQDRTSRLASGKRVLLWALKQKKFQMTYTLEVRRKPDRDRG